ncbi:MAG: LamG domain-containing protein, partial [Kiritimatiellae bacterium]|nr:LamG domain-containing protein [Kiritimatiellia bacterium]
MSIGAQTGGLAAAALLALAAGGILQSMPNRWFDKEPLERLAKRESAERREVLERGGLVAMWTFDGANLRTWHRDQEELKPGEPDPYGPAWPGTTAVKGRFGDARRFSGRDECYYNTGRSWKDRTGDFTAALWMKAREFPRKQDVTATAEAGLWGFRLDGDRLCFDVPLERGDWTTVDCPFKRDGRWRHIAFAMDKQAGEMRLWVDGERQATAPWLEPLLRDLPFCFGLASEKNDRDPFCGELDDAGVWDRALGDGEIRELAQGGKSLAEYYSTRKTRDRLKRARAQVRWRAALAKFRWKNWPRPWDGGGARLREVDLSLS